MGSALKSRLSSKGDEGGETIARLEIDLEEESSRRLAGGQEQAHMRPTAGTGDELN